MPSSFELLTLDEIHQVLVAAYAGLFPTDDVSEESDNWKRLRVLSLALAGDQYHLKVLYDDLLPDTATGVRLDRWGKIVNEPRKLATPAKKATALRCFGTPASSVAIGNQLTHTDGTRYQVNSNGTIPGGGTFVDVDVLAIDTGSITRKNKGETLTFSSPPAGIEAAATLQKDMDEDGTDKETDGDYRVRVLAKIAQPGMGGNPNDYRAWALQVTGVFDSFVYRARGGFGSVHLAAFHAGTGSQRALTPSEITTLSNYIKTKIPVSVEDFVVLTTTAEPTDVIVQITPEDGDAFIFDWDDVASARTVTSYTAGTRTLKLSANRPTDMLVGDRLTWKTASAPFHNGSEVVIEAFGAAADEVILRAPIAGEYDWTATPPKAGDNVYSGGPLVAPVRKAIIDHIDSLGPSRGIHAAFAWVGTLYTSKIFYLVQTTPGVLDNTILSPIANVVPTNNPPAPNVGYVTARQVIARKA